MIGVLALQGDYSKHIEILHMLNFKTMEIRYPHELSLIKGLVIPGGESTTISDLMCRYGLHESIKKFSKQKPILGTCAGLIIMSKDIADSRVKSLGILNLSIDRNAYGRQLDSFIDNLKVSLNGKIENIPATFIRAPKITKVDESVEILSNYNNAPVVVKQGHHLGLAFHPELVKTTIFHEYVFRQQFEIANAT